MKEKIVVRERSFEVTRHEDYLALHDMFVVAAQLEGEEFSRSTPAEWLRRPEQRDLIEHLKTIESVAAPVTKRWDPVTKATKLFAHHMIALAYAEFLSTELHVAVLKIFQAHVESGGKIPGPGEKAQVPGTTGDEPGHLEAYERHLYRLLGRKLITNTQALDAMTLEIKRFTGIDLTNIPELKYNQGPVQVAAQPRIVDASGVPVTVQPQQISDTRGYPYNAKEAGMLIYEDLNLLWKAESGQRKRKDLSHGHVGDFFAQILRRLRWHPVPAKNYEPTPDEIEATKPYACIANLEEKNFADGGLKQKALPHAYFSRKAVDAVRDYARHHAAPKAPAA